MSDQDVKCNSVDESVSSTDEDKKEQITGDQEEKCDINIKSDCYPVEDGTDQITSNQGVTCDISIKSDCSPVEDGKNQIVSEENVKCSISTGSDEFSQTVDNADSDSLITTKLESESEFKGIDNMAANISEIARPVDVCNAQIEQPKCDIDVENENDRIINTDKSDSNLLFMEHKKFDNADAKIPCHLSQGDNVVNEMSTDSAIGNGTFSENIDTSENDSLLAEKEPQFQGIDNLAVDVTDDGSDTSSDIDKQDKLKIIGQEFENFTVQSLDNNMLKDKESVKTSDYCISNSESTSFDTHENNKGDVEITCDTNSQSELYMSDENLSGDEVNACKEPLDNLLGIYNENGGNISTNEITAFEKRENVKSIDDSETWDIDNSFDDEENTDDHIDDQVKVCISDENSEKEQVVINNDESKIGALENNISTGGRVFNKNLYTINEIEVVENNNEKMFSELCQGDVNEMEYSTEKSNNKFEQNYGIVLNKTLYEQDEDKAHVIIESPQLEDLCQCGYEQKTSSKHHICHKNCEVVQALFTNNGNHDISDCLNHLSDKDNQTSNLGNYKLETINESCHESINPSNQFHDHSEKTCDFTKNIDNSDIDCDKTDNNDSVFKKENNGKVMYEQTNHDWHQVNHDHQLGNNHKNDSNHDSEIAPDLIDKPVTNLSSRLHVDSEELFFEEENISDELCHSEISDNLKVLSDSKCNMCNLPDGQSCDKCVHHTKSHDDHSDCVHENNCHCHHHQQLSSKNKSHQHSAEELYDKHLSDVDFHNRKHFPDLNHSADDMSVEDGAYLTCSDNEQDEHSTCSEHEHGEHCSSMRYSQPESGFGETMSSDFNLTDKVFSHDSHLESQFEDLLEVENIEVPSPEESFEDCQYTNCHHDNTIDWDEGSICGCPDCLGRLRIERIITANKSTMCPDEAPYVLMCEICEELLENQLQKTEKDSKKKEVTLKKQVKDLKEENEKQQKIIQQNLQLGPEAKIEATMQHEITRLTSENLDLRESNDKNQDQIRKLKKMLKTYAKRLKDGEAAEIAAEMDKDDTKSNGDNVAHVKHRKGITWAYLKPRVAVGLLPGLPAYVLFMCVRHTDYVNDDLKIPAVLEHEAIAGLTASNLQMNKYSQILAQHAVDPELVKQIFRQLYYFVASGALNNLLLRKDMCNWSKGMQIRYNLSHLEQWLRDNKLGESGALSALEPITQASQLLQARKTDADVDSICEMCSKLTTPQIVKILNLYTPVDEFEERVPVSFIRKIQKKLQGRQEADNTLLMDTKYTFPVTFPFNPSSIAMETIDVPEQLHLGFLNRH
ncbi:MYO5 [Mytilus edulis]|uniref:MYO5 n=1 Tax=Mytilus edulis TaxID=6550 RepID=A0A8S3RP26_MYTED|nr:MYO5 [Mytilus edulis]